ncbi:MAG TPA: hydroxyisourate hydrolase [Actinomycetota bacterium]
MVGITTHVLDTSEGRPAPGVAVSLEIMDGEGWRAVGRGVTDADGRVSDLLADRGAEAGTYRIVFDSGAYFASRGTQGFYPRVTVEFRIEEPGEHHHVPLLLSPFGYSTYRGS